MLRLHQGQHVHDAVQVMADGGAETRLMAGGTTLYDLVKLNIEVPARVGDISGLNELRTINTFALDKQIFGAWRE
jgi:xanthine dehydrogenase YagS FAD-binding subunit